MLQRPSVEILINKVYIIHNYTKYFNKVNKRNY